METHSWSHEDRGEFNALMDESRRRIADHEFRARQIQALVERRENRAYWLGVLTGLFISLVIVLVAEFYR